MDCPICNAETREFGRQLILGKHEAVYRRCPKCEFIYLPEPKWFEEAYSNPVTCSDVGMVDRCLKFTGTARAVIELLCDHKQKFIDYGGGAGLFTRLMRDRGYDYYCYDRHSVNLYAEGFSADLGGKYELLTAVEVVEHLQYPVATFQEMAALSSNIFFMTQLLPSPPPEPGQWWYYGPEHGQHVGFFGRKTLQFLADLLGLEFVSNGHNLHLFSAKPVSEAYFRVLISRPFSMALNVLVRRKSLLMSDFHNSRRQKGGE